MCTLIISAGQTHDGAAYLEWLDFMAGITRTAESQGSGATGVMCEYDNGETFWRKRPMPCRDVMTKMLGVSKMPNLLAIHARSGGNYPDDRDYDKNHHPFPGKNVLVMHEGYARSDWHTLAKTLGIELHTLTDSELLMHLIDGEANIVSGIRQAFGMLKDWVVGTAIYDRRTPGKMYFASKDKRCSPYHILRSTLFGTTTLISRASMVANAHNIAKLEKWGINLGETIDVDPNTLYTFEPDGSWTTVEL